MPTPSSPPLPAAAPPILSSPLERRVGVVPAVLFLSSLAAVVYLVRVGVLPPWSLVGLALWVAPSALFQEVGSSQALRVASELLAAHHQALAFLVSRLSDSQALAHTEPSSAVAQDTPSTRLPPQVAVAAPPPPQAPPSP